MKKIAPVPGRPSTAEETRKQMMTVPTYKGDAKNRKSLQKH